MTGSGGAAAFVAMAINPIGGLMVAIPFAIFELGYRPWVAYLLGQPFAYVQVLVIDLSWTLLSRWPWFHAWIARRRSPRLQRIVDSRGGFWVTLLFSPLVGPWLVMALMRYAGVPHRRVALPLALGIAWSSGLVVAACVWVPALVHH